MKRNNESNYEGRSCVDRRTMLKATLGVTVTGLLGGLAFATPEIAYAASLTKEERDTLTADEIIAGLKAGNERFRAGQMKRHDYLAQKRTSAAGQFPSAIILSCIDSRAPAEIVFDLGLGESFNSRVAGNVSNKDILGSIEYACAVAGAKVVVVMGHTSCGAIKGAIADVKLGNLTGLLNEIKPAIEATPYLGQRVETNYNFVDAVAKTNVQQTIRNLRKGSSILSELEKGGKIKMVGAMYSLKGGKVEFFS